MKKNARVYRKIRNVRGLSVDEKWLFAKTLAATPDQRWQMLRNHLRLLGLSTRSAQKKRGLFLCDWQSALKKGVILDFVFDSL